MLAHEGVDKGDGGHDNHDGGDRLLQENAEIPVRNGHRVAEVLFR